MSGFSDIFEKYREGILYLVYGGFTVLVSWGTYSLFVMMGIDLNISNILSWICGVLFAFVTNKWLVFESRSLEKKVLVKEISSFFTFRIITFIISVVTFPLLLHIGLDQSLFGVSGLIARIITSIIEIIINYVASKFVVFRKKEEDA